MKLLLKTKRGLRTYNATPVLWSSKRNIGVATILHGAMTAYYTADPAKPYEAGIVVRKDATIANRNTV